MTALKRLLVIIQPVMPMMALAALFSFLTVAANIGLLTTSAYLIATAALHPPLAALAVAITGVRFFGTSRAVFRYAERYISHKATFQILYALRVWFYSRLEPLAPAVLEKYRSGDLLGRIVADVDTLQFFYLRVIAPPVVASVTLAGMWWFLGSYSMALGWLLTIAFVIGGAIVPYLLRRAGRENSCQLLQARAELKALLADTIHGLPELAAYDQTGRYLTMLEEQASAISRLQGKGASLSALAEGLNSLVMNAAIWGALLIAIPLASSGAMEKIYLAVVTLAVQASFEAIQPLPLAAYILEESLAAARRLFSIADQPPAAKETGGDYKPDNFDLVFEGVSFRYEDDRPVLEDISFAVPSGSRIAIVGASGAGKTTLASLLLRFTEYGGSIRLGGRELASYHPEKLRSFFAVVSQHTHIFNATLEDNIRLACPDATTDALVAAARRAAIHDFIAALPQGYQTPAGLNGKTLSGGQRQRIAIARAILKDAPILILDEPTVGLDAVTEQEVMKAIADSMQGRTTLLITHRLTGLDHMDEILVLDQGRISERGTMQELLAKQGLFYQMWRLQHDVMQ